VRTWTLVLIAAGVTACAAEDKMTADFREDLALASSSEGLALASAANASTQVVGEVEQVARRKPQPAPSRRAPRPRPAPQPLVEAEPQSDGQSEEMEVAMAEPEPQPTEDRGFDGMGTSAIPAPRPQPAEVQGSGTVIYAGGGSGLGSILGGIGIAVIRGGAVIDRCDPRTDGRNARRVRGTFGEIVMPGRISGPVRSGSGSSIAINDRTPRAGSARGPVARGGGGSGGAAIGR
jgi:hypothetical protein